MKAERFPERKGDPWWISPSPGRWTQSVRSADPVTSVLKRFTQLFQLEGASVLEVGGAAPLAETGILVGEWVAVDPAEVGRTAGAYSVIQSTIEEAALPTSAFDLVFSCNAFEHIKRLDSALEAIRDSLRPGGYVFSQFGPIWSAPDGHHLEKVMWQGNELVFWERNCIPHWTHLLFDPPEFTALLQQHCEPELADAISTQVLAGDWTNKLFFEDYLMAFERAGLSIVLLQTQAEIDYPMAIQADQYRHPILELAQSEVLQALAHQYGPDHREFLTRDIEVVLRRPL